MRGERASHRACFASFLLSLVLIYLHFVSLCFDCKNIYSLLLSSNSSSFFKSFSCWWSLGEVRRALAQRNIGLVIAARLIGCIMIAAVLVVDWEWRPVLTRVGTCDCSRHMRNLWNFLRDILIEHLFDVVKGLLALLHWCAIVLWQLELEVTLDAGLRVIHVSTRINRLQVLCRVAIVSVDYGSVVLLVAS